MGYVGILRVLSLSLCLVSWIFCGLFPKKNTRHRLRVCVSEKDLSSTPTLESQTEVIFMGAEGVALFVPLAVLLPSLTLCL